MKQYVCTIDQAKFSSEEGLINHLKQYYSLVENIEGKSSTALTVLKEAFPEAVIELTERENGSIVVDLVFKDYGAEFNFLIHTDDNHDEYCRRTFSNIDDAIKNYKWYLDQKDQLVKGLKERINATDIEITQIYESDPYSSDSSIKLKFKINGKEIYEEYEFDGIDEFLNRMKGHVITEVEGECVFDYGRYGSKGTIFVNGIDLRDMAKRAKRMRVEILETR